MVAEHWLESLREEGILVKCPPDQFTAPDDWIPLYTRAGLQHYLPVALSAFQNQGVPSLIAVTPPDFHVSSDKEFLLSNFHSARVPSEAIFQHRGEAQAACLLPVLRSHQGEL